MEYVQVDVFRNALSYNKKTLVVRPMVADLASLFAVHPPGKIISRQDIIEAIWGRPVMTDEPVSQLVYNLRKNMQFLGVYNPIKTVRKQGFALRVGVVFEIV